MYPYAFLGTVLFYSSAEVLPLVIVSVGWVNACACCMSGAACAVVAAAERCRAASAADNVVAVLGGGGTAYPPLGGTGRAASRSEVFPRSSHLVIATLSNTYP